jgi:hypothetical protein
MFAGGAAARDALSSSELRNIHSPAHGNRRPNLPERPWAAEVRWRVRHRILHAIVRKCMLIMDFVCTKSVQNGCGRAIGSP